MVVDSPIVLYAARLRLRKEGWLQWGCLNVRGARIRCVTADGC